MPTSLTTSLTVNLRSDLILSRTRSMVSFVFDVDGRPGRWSSSMDIRPSLKRLNQSKVTQRLSATSPKANFINSKVSVAFLLILKQNLIHARCSEILSIVKSRFYTNDQLRTRIVDD